MSVAGYKEVQWANVKTGDEIYILDAQGNNGAGKAYGPYKIVDYNKRTVEDTTTFNSGPWAIMPNEIIGVPDPNVGAATASAIMAGGAFAAPPSSLVQAQQMLDSIYDFVVFKIAAQDTNLDAATRLKIEAEVVTRQGHAINLLQRIINRT